MLNLFAHLCLIVWNNGMSSPFTIPVDPNWTIQTMMLGNDGMVTTITIIATIVGVNNNFKFCHFTSLDVIVPTNSWPNITGLSFLRGNEPLKEFFFV